VPYSYCLIVQKGFILEYLQLNSIRYSPYSEYTESDILSIEDTTGLRFGGYLRNKVGNTLVVIPVFVRPDRDVHKRHLLETGEDK
jgi:hypothetical protein